MIRIVSYIIVGVLVSFYLFPIGLTFLPAVLNTKNLLAAVGVVVACYHSISRRELTIPKVLLISIAIAVVFSLVSLFAVDYNDTNDYSYATYIVSFFVWLFASYAVCASIKNVHGQVKFPLIVAYMAGVSVVQCVLALLIDSFPVFQELVDTYIDQGQGFLVKVDRLYGIGASLDNAGVRFAVILPAIVAVISTDRSWRDSKIKLLLALFAFFFIVIVGNMISRTTSTGAGLAVLYVIANRDAFRLTINFNSLKFNFRVAFFILIGVLVTAYLYKTNAVFHGQLRFAFEGFFNWIEMGEWRTDSTDKLNANMWVWPTDTKSWIIGTGLFDNWVYGTDIGYCRFILYCGLVGFSVFAAFFIYQTVAFSYIYPKYIKLLLIYLILVFVIWIKVATDIFFLYALLYSMYLLNQSESYQNENNLLHSRNI